MRHLPTCTGAALASAILACAPPPPQPAPPTPIDPGATAAGWRARNRLAEPLRVRFDWSANEPGLRVSGRGVARVEPPYRARLDLFASNGETALIAALVDDDLRVPPGAVLNLVPPASLLWAALGVFRPEPGAGLVSTVDRLDGDQLRLQYLAPDGAQVRFTARDDRVVLAEVVRGGNVVRRVQIEWGDDTRFPRRAVYRDLADFRELTVEVTEVVPVESFPPDIWDPFR